jgi:hypothetical protein
MKYIVIKQFKDLQDNDYIYEVDDKYPRKGRAKKARIEELLSHDNKIGEPLIKEVGD